MNLLEAKQLAETLIKRHGLYELGWRFEFDNSKRRFGVCRYLSKTIGLSKNLTALNEVEQVKDTILHEIAHALTPGHHHDWVWQRKAIEIGCNGERCYSPNEVVTPQSKYIAVCCGCGKTHKKHRQAKRESSCGNCSNGRYNPTYKLEWKLNPNF
jgi:predicted SprT family Zn-dependent metalloprotease